MWDQRWNFIENEVRHESLIKYTYDTNIYIKYLSKVIWQSKILIESDMGHRKNNKKWCVTQHKIFGPMYSPLHWPSKYDIYQQHSLE